MKVGLLIIKTIPKRSIACGLAVSSMGRMSGCSSCIASVRRAIRTRTSGLTLTILHGKRQNTLAINFFLCGMIFCFNAIIVKLKIKQL